MLANTPIVGREFNRLLAYFRKIMAKSKRNRRAKNKIAGSAPGPLAKAESLVTTDPFLEPAASAAHRGKTAWISKGTLFSAELEAIIEIIARDRVYRTMLARLGRRLLPPPMDGDVLDA